MRVDLNGVSTLRVISSIRHALSAINNHLYGNDLTIFFLIITRARLKLLLDKIDAFFAILSNNNFNNNFM